MGSLNVIVKNTKRVLFRNAVVEEEHLFDGDEYPIRLVMVYMPEDSEPVEMFSIELNQSQIAELHANVVPAARGGGDDVPMESLSLSFGKIRMNAAGRDEDGGYRELMPDEAIAVDNPAFEDDED